MVVDLVKAAGCPLIKYKIVADTAQFSSGSKAVDSGFSTVHGAVATVKGANETVYWSASGGTVTFTSSNGSSTAYFSYLIWGE